MPIKGLIVAIFPPIVIIFFHQCTLKKKLLKAPLRLKLKKSIVNSTVSRVRNSQFGFNDLLLPFIALKVINKI